MTRSLFLSLVAISLVGSANAGNEILVRYKSSVPHVSQQKSGTVAIQSVLGLGATVSSEQLKSDPMIHVIKIDKPENMDKALNALKSNPDVDVAEENIDIQLFANPTDPDFGKQWGMSNTGQKIAGGGGWTGGSGGVGVAGVDINVAPLWSAGITGSDGIIVAVLDTGVDREHPDLKSNIFVNKGEIPGNGKDDDGNGFIDDVYGWNFAEGNNNTMDDHNHGSHCAGVIGAVGNNTVGVAGVNWKVKILPVKIFDSKGRGKLSVAIDAIKYATQMGARVMSNSWGWAESSKERKARDKKNGEVGISSLLPTQEDMVGVSKLMREAIEAAGAKGALFVAAAGNARSDNDEKPHFPSSYTLDNIISVAAIDNKGKLASFSCYGKTSVDVAAPGVNVFSTAKDGKYMMMSGTSMATPHVSGIAALALSANPSMSLADLRKRILSGVVASPELQGKISTGGRVNAENIVRGL